tara:strand:- start:664 stop:1065 length:402 start_codon:yes stop_codon:yes gene_type:complete
MPTFSPYLLLEGKYEREIGAHISVSSPTKRYGRKTFRTSWYNLLCQVHELYNFECCISNCLKYAKKTVFIIADIDDLECDDPSESIYEDERVSTNEELVVAIPVCISCESKTRENIIIEIEDTPCVIDYEGTR